MGICLCFIRNLYLILCGHLKGAGGLVTDLHGQHAVAEGLEGNGDDTTSSLNLKEDTVEVVHDCVSLGIAALHEVDFRLVGNRRVEDDGLLLSVIDIIVLCIVVMRAQGDEEVVHDNGRQVCLLAEFGGTGKAGARILGHGLGILYSDRLIFDDILEASPFGISHIFGFRACRHIQRSLVVGLFGLFPHIIHLHEGIRLEHTGRLLDAGDNLAERGATLHEGVGKGAALNFLDACGQRQRLHTRIGVAVGGHHLQGTGQLGDSLSHIECVCGCDDDRIAVLARVIDGITLGHADVA